MSHQPTPAALPAAIAPALLIGDSAALFADVRKKTADFYRPGAPGNFAIYTDWLRLEEVLNHAEALIARAEAAEHELGACQQNQAGHELDCAGLTARAEKAEARAKEMQMEMAEQERAKLLLIQETHRWSAVELLTKATALRAGLCAHEAMEAERIAKIERAATCIFPGCKNGQVHDGACECYVNGRAHGEEAAQ